MNNKNNDNTNNYNKYDNRHFKITKGGFDYKSIRINLSSFPVVIIVKKDFDIEELLDLLKDDSNIKQEENINIDFSELECFEISKIIHKLDQIPLKDKVKFTFKLSDFNYNLR